MPVEVTATVTTVSGVTAESFGWLRRSTKPLGRWNSRSMMRGGSLAAAEKPREQLFQLRADAGQS